MRLLVDANVFLDVFFNRQDQQKEAAEFFTRCFLKHEIYVTAMTIRDVEYVTHKAFHDYKKSRLYALRVYEMCTKIVDSVDGTIAAIYSEVKDFEDALIIENARYKMVDAIVTSNKKDFIKSDIPIFNPKEINEYLERVK